MGRTGAPLTTRLPGGDAAGATPLTDEDIDGLIPTFVATRADLNLAEQANIEAATLWAFGRRRVASTDRLLTIDFADRVHRRMFGDPVAPRRPCSGFWSRFVSASETERDQKLWGLPA